MRAECLRVHARAEWRRVRSGGAARARARGRCQGRGGVALTCATASVRRVLPLPPRSRILGLARIFSHRPHEALLGMLLQLPHLLRVILEYMLQIFAGQAPQLTEGCRAARRGAPLASQQRNLPEEFAWVDGVHYGAALQRAVARARDESTRWGWDEDFDGARVQNVPAVTRPECGMPAHAAVTNRPPPPRQSTIPSYAARPHPSSPPAGTGVRGGAFACVREGKLRRRARCDGCVAAREQLWRLAHISLPTSPARMRTSPAAACIGRIRVTTSAMKESPCGIAIVRAHRYARAVARRERSAGRLWQRSGRDLTEI